MGAEKAKENIQPVDTQTVLEHLAAIPIQTWNYKTDDPSIRHIGPMAQDFAAAFGVGEDDKHIHSVDAAGVAFAAIQALHTVVQKRQAELTSMRDQLAAIEEEVRSLQEEVVRT